LRHFDLLGKFPRLKLQAMTLFGVGWRIAASRERQARSDKKDKNG
jgi:hypothetical protein